jgi:5-methylcytosine-specific restriction endonuclease McrA
MWKLNAPEVLGAEQELKTALTPTKRKPSHRMTWSQRKGILKLYARYQTLRGQPSTGLLGSRFADAFRTAVFEAYSQVQDNGRLSGLRSRLKVAALKCPYCGFGEVSELDHHLPRSKYKLLAIFATNLIPCCHVCNNRKSALAEAEPDAQIAHVYLDQFPPARFLLANVDVSTGGLRATFSIHQCAGMPAELFRRIEFQFSRFDLNTRYQAEVDTFIGSHRNSIEDAATHGSGSLRSWLQSSRDALQRQFGLNDWRPALLDALLQSNDFCEGGFKHCFGDRDAGA